MERFISPRDARAGTIDSDQLLAVRRLARMCLERPPLGSIGAESLVESVGEARLWQAIQRHRLVEVVDQSGVLPPGTALARELRQDADRRRALVDEQAVATADVLEVLRAQGVDALVLKGLPLALQTTGSPHGRASSDIDLWVDPESLMGALRALQGTGWSLRLAGQYPQPDDRRGWRWVGLTQREVQVTRNGISVDLHWRLAAATGHVPGFAAAWQAREEIPTAWGPIPTLRPDHALAHTCLHAATDDWRSLRSLVDVRRLAGRLDPTRVSRLADRLGAVRRSLLVTQHCLGLPGEITVRPHLVDRDLRTVADRSQMGPGRIHTPATHRERLSASTRQALLGGTGPDYLRWLARLRLRRRLQAVVSGGRTGTPYPGSAPDR